MEKFVCKVCGREVEKNRNKGNQGKLCNSCRQKYRKLKMKQKAIDYLGGKCSVCGYDKYKDALEFHHRNSTTKEFNIASNSNLSWESIKNELDKCDLLCANCHRELHARDKDRPCDYTIYEQYIDSPDTELIAVKKKIKEVKKKELAKKKEDNFNFILDCVYNSGIDYSSKGWGQKLADLIGYERPSAVRWVRKNTPTFYANNCCKTERVDKSYIDNFIEMYKDGIKVTNIAVKTGFCVDTISRYLHENGIDVKQDSFKHVGMYDEDNKLIKDFSSISEASQYVEANLAGRGESVNKSSARRKIGACVNGRQKTSYGYIWKEIKD